MIKIPSISVFSLFSYLCFVHPFPPPASEPQPLSPDTHPPSIHAFPDTNTTSPDPLTAWPSLPWWTKLQDSNPQAFLDISSIGAELTTLESYTLQEVILIPLSFKIHSDIGPTARKTHFLSSGGIKAQFVPNEHRPPGRDIAAKAITALAFFEKRFGARTVKAGLRLGMVRVAGIEVLKEVGIE